MKRIAIFASGSGTNAENIIHYSRSNNSFEVVKLYCNKPSAGIIEKASKMDIPIEIFSKNVFYSSNYIIDDLLAKKIDSIVLAGFLWLIPDSLLQAYNDKIINIHPALLPKFGGKGMYGMKVHEAVKASGEKETGITIHKINAEYDRGQILFQARCQLTDNDTPESIALKIHQLEFDHFPRVIDSFLQQ
jgi:phosphoribosylglycinamide formyltransferase-1